MHKQIFVHERFLSFPPIMSSTLIFFLGKYIIIFSLMRSQCFYLVITIFLLIRLYLQEQKFEKYKKKTSKKEIKRAKKFKKKMKEFENKLIVIETKLTKFEDVMEKRRKFIFFFFILFTIDLYTATFSHCILNGAQIISVQGDFHRYHLGENGKFSFYCFLLDSLKILFYLSILN
jgi:hypothetical protein